MGRPQAQKQVGRQRQGIWMSLQSWKDTSKELGTNGRAIRKALEDVTFKLKHRLERQHARGWGPWVSEREAE